MERFRFRSCVSVQFRTLLLSLVKLNSLISSSNPQHWRLVLYQLLRQRQDLYSYCRRPWLEMGLWNLCYMLSPCPSSHRKLTAIFFSGFSCQRKLIVDFLRRSLFYFTPSAKLVMLDLLTRARRSLSALDSKSSSTKPTRLDCSSSLLR